MTTYVHHTCKVFLPMLAKPSDDGQCWPKHVKIISYILILNLFYLMGLATNSCIMKCNGLGCLIKIHHTMCCQPTAMFLHIAAVKPVSPTYSDVSRHCNCKASRLDFTTEESDTSRRNQFLLSKASALPFTGLYYEFQT
jgi:hypothetical protein